MLRRSTGDARLSGPKRLIRQEKKLQQIANWTTFAEFPRRKFLLVHREQARQGRKQDDNASSPLRNGSSTVDTTALARLSASSVPRALSPPPIRLPCFESICACPHPPKRYRPTKPVTIGRTSGSPGRIQLECADALPTPERNRNPIVSWHLARCSR